MGSVPQIFVVAGEPSADRHAAMLGAALRERKRVNLTGVGQSLMAGADYDLLYDSSGWSGIGVIDSLRKIPLLWMRMRRIVAQLLENPPDLLVPIDFGAFNVRLLRRIRTRLDCPVLYYFPPRSWSREADYSGLTNLVDRVATPFQWSERRLAEAGIDGVWTGHPVVDRIHPPDSEEREALRAKFDIDTNQTVVGLLPGSRRTEIRCNGPQMLEAAQTIAREISGTVFLVSVAPGVSEEALRDQVQQADLSDRTRLVGGLREIVEAADMVISASGTATLEAAAAGCPMVIMYRGTWLMSLEKRLRGFAPRFVGMPNILAGEQVVPELIDQDAVAPKIARTTLELLEGPSALSRMRERLLDVRGQLGTEGVSERIAQMALEMIGL